MRIKIINPNTTATMTDTIRAAAQAVADESTQLVCVNPHSGPVSIEGYYDEALSVPGLLEEIKTGEHDSTDAYIIACFDDTGLDAARCVARGPVIGICEAAVRAATMVANSFAVVTTMTRSVPALKHLLHRYGVERHCACVRATDIPVLELENPASNARTTIAAEIRIAMESAGAEAIVLGCAGMADLNRDLEQEFGVPVIDGVSAAVKFAEALVGLGISTSKIGGYAEPLPKTYTGLFAHFSAD